MKCPKCGIEMETGISSPLPQPPHHWAECPECKLFQTASSYQELEKRLEPSEKQEITSKNIGKVEDIFK